MKIPADELQDRAKTGIPEFSSGASGQVNLQSAMITH
jgi:hypothetical protein